MKILITLLATSAMFSQSKPQFTPDNKHLLLPIEKVKPLYFATQELKQCEEENISLRQSVFELGNSILTIKSDYESMEVKLTELESEKQGYLDEAEKLMIDNAALKATRPKRWGLGVSAGATYYNGVIKPYIGVGINRNLISF